MASSTSTPLSLSSTLVDGKPLPLRPLAATSSSSLSQCVTLVPPSLAPPSVHSFFRTSSAYCRKIARSVVVGMATGEAPAAAAAAGEVSTTELLEFVKPLQETWDKIEDKYAVTSLAVAVAVALWASTGMISAIDRLPLVPGVLELVGIGYTGWFAYKNLIFQPDREALIQKIKDTYNDIIGGGGSGGSGSS